MALVFEKKLTSQKPRYSILVPSFNRPEYIVQTIHSVSALQGDHFELVISDDQSPRFGEILEAVQSQSYRCNCRLYSQEENLKWSENRNFLVQHAEGDYVILLGDDDLLSPSLLTELDIVIDGAAVVPDIIAFGYEVIDEHGKHVYSRHFPSPQRIGLRHTTLLPDMIESNIFPFCFFHPFTLCYKKNIGFSYDRRAHIGDDYLFLYECLNAGKEMMVLPIIGFSWRKAQKKTAAYMNLSSLGRNNVIARANIWKLFFQRGDLASPIKRLITDRFMIKYLGYPVVIDEELDKEEMLSILNASVDSHGQQILFSFLTSSTKMKKLKIRVYQLRRYLNAIGVSSTISFYLADRRDKKNYETTA